MTQTTSAEDPKALVRRLLAPIASDMKAVDDVIRSELASDVSRMHEISDYITSAGGKRMRPALLILICRALGYKGDLCCYLGATIELLHTATLMHDDVVDESAMRRGRPTANARWGHRWGLYHLNVNLNGRIQEGRYSKTYYYDPAPGFSQWDLNTRHSFNLKSVVLEPGFGVENLFDKVDDRPWNSNYSTLNPGRSFYVSLSVRFN